MHSFYIDDSRQERARASILGGFIVEEGAYTALQTRYRTLKTQYDLTPEDAAKWSPPRAPSFRKQRGLRSQNAFRIDVLKLLAASPIKIVATAIEEQGVYDKDKRHQYLCAALDFLAQGFERELSAQHSSGRMILDYPGAEHELDMMKHYHQIRLRGSNYPSSSMQLSSLDETIYYSHCITCDGLQLADFVVGALSYSVDRRRYDYIRLLRYRIRKMSGEIKGAGIVVYPSNSLVMDGVIRACEEA
jgi:hypothetical protein